MDDHFDCFSAPPEVMDSGRVRLGGGIRLPSVKIAMRERDVVDGSTALNDETRGAGSAV